MPGDSSRRAACGAAAPGRRLLQPALALLAFGLLLARPVPALAADAPTVVAAVHGDWSVLCFADPRVVPACEIAQLARNRGASGTYVAQFSLSCMGAHGPCGVQLLLPPDVDPAEKVLVVLKEEGQPLLVPVSDCTAASCMAAGSLPAAVLDGLEASAACRFEYRDRRGSAQAIPVSLKGFEAAMAEMLLRNGAGDGVSDADADQPLEKNP